MASVKAINASLTNLSNLCATNAAPVRLLHFRFQSRSPLKHGNFHLCLAELAAFKQLSYQPPTGTDQLASSENQINWFNNYYTELSVTARVEKNRHLLEILETF